MTALKNIIVVGGSYVATYVIDDLAPRIHKTHRIIMIERNSHLQHIFAFPRITSVPGFTQKAFCPYTNAFHEPEAPAHSVEVVHGVVERVLPDRVVLGSGEEIEYEYLVMATGTGHPDGGLEKTTKLGSVRKFEGIQRRVKESQEVVVVGGGAWGIQLAFDTKEYYPEKNVTVVHSRTQLLNRFHPKLHEIVAARAAQIGVNLVLGQRVKLPPGGFPVTGPAYSVELADGRKLPADVAIQCMGAVALSGPLRSLAPSAINPASGYIRVKPTMQIDAPFPRVFAVGDVADTGANKAAAPGFYQAQVASRNIERMVRGCPRSELERYMPDTPGIHLAIGLHRYVTFMDPEVPGGEPEVKFKEWKWGKDGEDASEEAKYCAHSGADYVRPRAFLKKRVSSLAMFLRAHKYQALSKLESGYKPALLVFLWVSLLLNAIAAYNLAILPRRFPESGYSPAEGAIKYKQLKFHRGFADDVPIYERRPSPEVDAAWEDLYAYAATRIPRSEAVKMTNKTWPVLDEPGNYVIALEVFHQLHCLDMIRQELRLAAGNYTRMSRAHLRHCIGAIRQALMCYADTTPIVWQWSPEFNEAIQRDDLVHTCRDFDEIQQWAKQRSMGLLPDLTVYIEE
ncbi:FAD/NAD(P)-binding domain-containing protein [Mycena kentingensis (nom. inval.)]|nr:FAD/NAD(P)-binding domain-containing protein [Mycena kentingensis (nom. inval.)]